MITKANSYNWKWLRPLRNSVALLGMLLIVLLWLDVQVIHAYALEAVILRNYNFSELDARQMIYVLGAALLLIPVVVDLVVKLFGFIKYQVENVSRKSR